MSDLLNSAHGFYSDLLTTEAHGITLLKAIKDDNGTLTEKHFATVRLHLTTALERLDATKELAASQNGLSPGLAGVASASPAALAPASGGLALSASGPFEVKTADLVRDHDL